MNRYHAISLAVILSVVICGVVSAATGEETCVFFEDSAIRLEATVLGFPLSNAETRIDGVVSMGNVTASAWAVWDFFAQGISGFGGSLSLDHEWLSIRFEPAIGTDCQISAVGVAAPPAWLIADGWPTLLAGLDATARATLLGDGSRTQLTLSPYVAGILTSGSLLAKPQVGFDIVLDASQASIARIGETRLSSTLDIDCVTVSSVVVFDGCFDALNSVSIAVSLPLNGVTVTGAWLPTGGGSVYRLGVRLDCGDSTLFPSGATSGPLCTGDTCY